MPRLMQTQYTSPRTHQSGVLLSQLLASLHLVNVLPPQPIYQTLLFEFFEGLVPRLNLSLVSNCFWFTSADEEVTGGNIQLSLSINNIPFVNMPLDLCDAVQQAGLSCPLSKGNHSISVTEEIPDLAPPVSPCGFGLLVRFCQVTKTLRSTWKLVTLLLVVVNHNWCHIIYL